MTRRLSPSELRREISRLLKASQPLTPSEMIPDHWTAGHVNRAPRRETVEFGAPQAASGGYGLTHMIARYSDPAPQHGATRTAAELARDLAYTKAEASGLERSVENLKSATVKLAAHIAANQDRWAEGGADDDDDEDDRPARAKARLRALRKRVREADEEVEDAETASERRRAARKATQAREEAVKTLTGQVQNALTGLGLLTSDVRSVNQMILGRGRAGGVPPMQKAADLPSTPFMKATPARRAEILKATGATLSHRAATGTLQPQIERECQSFLRLLQSPVAPAPEFLKSYAARLSSDARAEISHLIG